MPITEILILGLIQALTEFLPVSSSAHLFLTSWWLGWAYQGVTFDLGLHLGTLIAIVVYFRRDWLRLFDAGLRWRPALTPTADQRLLLLLILATIPAALVALMMGSDGAMWLRHPVLIAINLILFGILLWWADRIPDRGDERTLTLGRGMLIGLAQALALMPGVSRSGITMTAGLLVGLDRMAAARFSFLLAVPVTTLATLKGIWDLLTAEVSEPLRVGDFLLGAAISAIAGLACIHLFLAVIRRIGLAPFMVYRVVLGTILLCWWFFVGMVPIAS
jgi:undecaprenyl-diphosphatase